VLLEENSTELDYDIAGDEEPLYIIQPCDHGTNTSCCKKSLRTCMLDFSSLSLTRLTLRRLRECLGVFMLYFEGIRKLNCTARKVKNCILRSRRSTGVFAVNTVTLLRDRNILVAVGVYAGITCLVTTMSEVSLIMALLHGKCSIYFLNEDKNLLQLSCDLIIISRSRICLESRNMSVRTKNTMAISYTFLFVCFFVCVCFVSDFSSLTGG